VIRAKALFIGSDYRANFHEGHFEYHSGRKADRPNGKPGYSGIFPNRPHGGFMPEAWATYDGGNGSRLGNPTDLMPN
jgi:hypothetical protein